MQQVIIRIPIPGWPDGIPIYGYGLMLFVAFLACTWLAGRRAQREGVAKEHIQDLAIWLFIGGLAGSRITFMLYHPPAGGWTLWDFLKQFPQIWDGGVILYGAVIGGLAAYCVAYHFIVRKHGLSGWKLADIVAPSIALGVGLGRIGCLLNGCCYGHVACPGCPGIPFPLSAPARYELTAHGFQTAAGFAMTMQNDDRIVASVNPESPVGKSGLKPGDVLVMVDRQKVRRFDDLVQYLAKLGDLREQRPELVLTVQRNGQVVELAPAAVLLSDFRTADDRVIALVEPGSAASITGLAAGDMVVRAAGGNDPPREVREYADLADLLANPRSWPRGEARLTLTVIKPDHSEQMISFVPWTLELYPTQIYETISMGLLFLLLIAYYPFRRQPGEVACVLMVGYSIHRYLNEMLRSDRRPDSFELISTLVLLLAGVGLFVWLRLRGRPAMQK